tara:strand:+ start:170 stop:1174 length:1005 start_codon:yes stop_codon:yes gene_type:complete
VQHRYKSYLAEIEKTHNIIEPYIKKTPLLSSKEFNTKLGMQVFCKAENLQVTGSFKIRGALSAISRLKDEELEHGVLAYSSGNHAQGVAMAAKCYNTNATIIMPKDAPKIKIKNTRLLGAKILFYDRDKDSRENIGEEIAKKNNLTIIKPYDSLETIFGQGTTALEATQQTDVMIDSSIICAGGGGLSAGCSIVLKKNYPKIKIYTAEPEDWNDHEISFKHKKILTSDNSGSRLCDGILTRQPGRIPFSINLALNLNGLSCEEAYVFEAIKLAKDFFSMNLEPSGAIGLANLIKHKEHFVDQNVLIVFSGGNIDSQTLDLCLSNAENNSDIIDI